MFFLVVAGRLFVNLVSCSSAVIVRCFALPFIGFDFLVCLLAYRLCILVSQVVRCSAPSLCQFIFIYSSVMVSNGFFNQKSTFSPHKLIRKGVGNCTVDPESCFVYFIAPIQKSFHFHWTMLRIGSTNCCFQNSLELITFAISRRYQIAIYTFFILTSWLTTSIESFDSVAYIASRFLSSQAQWF